MKKFILAIAAIVSISSISQAQFRIGIVAGATESTQRINGSGQNSLFSNGHYRNFNAGLTSELRVAENVYVQSQLLYSRKGATLLSSTGAADSKVRFNSIDVPVNVLYKLPLPFGKVFAGTGATVSYGFGGQQEQAGHSTKLYGDAGSWKHTDLALNFTAGFEFNNGLFASVNSRKGLLDVYKADNVSVKNRSMGFSIGYLVNLDKFRSKGK